MIETEFAHELSAAKHLAQIAGKAILRHYHLGVKIDYKSGGKSDPVTPADREANEIIVNGLSKEFPLDGFLAEESPVDLERLHKQRVWCVDPLDGTQEFIERNGQFVVMIGLIKCGQPVLGVVYQPTLERLWYGAGSKAFMSDKSSVSQLQVSDLADPHQAWLMVSRSHRSNLVSKVATQLNLAKEVPLGSVGLKVTQIASGAAHIYLSFSNRTHEWDICAPEAILRAAGGQVSDVLGQPLKYNKPDSPTPWGILATNTKLHAACLKATEPIGIGLGFGPAQS